MSKSVKKHILIGYIGMAALFLVISGLSFLNFYKLMFIGDAGFTAFISGLIFGLFGLALLGDGFIKRNCRETKSAKYAKERAAKLKESMDGERCRKLEQLADRYIEQYFKSAGWLRLITDAVFYGICSAIVILGRAKVSVIVWILIVIVVFALVTLRFYGKCFQTLIELLSTQCQPFAAVLAVLKPFGTRQFLSVNRLAYPYHVTISLGFYYMGEFEMALEHLQMMWEERPRYVKKGINLFHYLNLKMCCCRELGRLEEADRQRKLLEEYIGQHPKQIMHVYVTTYQRNEKIEALMKDQCYGEAKLILEEQISPKIPMYQRVGAHYHLWEIARLEGDLESVSLHSRFVSEYGKEMFYYARINGKL